MRKIPWRRALHRRLATLAAAALILWTVGTAVAASVATDGIADEIAAERRTRARGIAARIALALQDELRRLDLVAAASAGAPTPTGCRPRCEACGWLNQWSVRTLAPVSSGRGPSRTASRRPFP